MDLIEKYGQRFGLAVGLLSFADVAFWALRVTITGSSRFSFVPWNLALAWVSLATAVLLVRNLRHYRWLSWQNAALSALWLTFLPNTWYTLTDYVHVVPSGEISELFDIVLVGLLVITSFILGFASLFLVHRELLKRFGRRNSWAMAETVILVCSFAIYLGRDLRWNSWDVITNPGVLINASDTLVDPFGSQRALNVTVLFFILISLLYGAFLVFSYPVKAPKRRR